MDYYLISKGIVFLAIVVAIIGGVFFLKKQRDSGNK